MGEPHEVLSHQAEELSGRHQGEIVAESGFQDLDEAKRVLKTEPERVDREPEEVGTRFPCGHGGVQLPEDVVLRRPEMRRADDRGDRRLARLHPGISGPRLVVVVQNDPVRPKAVDVDRKTLGGVRDLGRGEGVQQPDDVHVGSVHVPFREGHEGREVLRIRIVRIEVARAARPGDESIEWCGGIVIHVEHGRCQV